MSCALCQKLSKMQIQQGRECSNIDLYLLHPNIDQACQGVKNLWRYSNMSLANLTGSRARPLGWSPITAAY